MSDEDFVWGEETAAEAQVIPPVGTYVWVVRIVKATVTNRESEKPYVNLNCCVIEGDYGNFTFEYRLYIHEKAKGWARYFLKKFCYKEELLDCAKPIIRPKEIEALTGKMQIDILAEPKFGSITDIKGFDYWDGDELENKLNPEVPIGTESSEPVIDVEGDVKQESAVDLSWMDEPEVDHSKDDYLDPFFYKDK